MPLVDFAIAEIFMPVRWILERMDHAGAVPCSAPSDIVSVAMAQRVIEAQGDPLRGAPLHGKQHAVVMLHARIVANGKPAEFIGELWLFEAQPAPVLSIRHGRTCRAGRDFEIQGLTIQEAAAIRVPDARDEDGEVEWK